MTNFLTSDFTIRPFDSERDSTVVASIVGEIWSGGDDPLMEEQFGIIGSKPWGHWTARSVLTYLTTDGASALSNYILWVE